MSRLIASFRDRTYHSHEKSTTHNRLTRVSYYAKQPFNLFIRSKKRGHFVLSAHRRCHESSSDRCVSIYKRENRLPSDKKPILLFQIHLLWLVSPRKERQWHTTKRTQSMVGGFVDMFYLTSKFLLSHGLLRPTFSPRRSSPIISLLYRTDEKECSYTDNTHISLGIDNSQQHS